MKRIFLDYAAGLNNPNAIYKEGREAAGRLAKARESIANVLAAAQDEIILTSWGTEANAALGRYMSKGDHVVTTTIEHESLLDLFGELEKRGVAVTYISPSPEGIVRVSDIQKAIRKNTKLVSVMYANNEIGTIQPIKEISRVLRTRYSDSSSFGYLLRKHGQSRRLEIPRPALHSDCVQAPGLLPINVQSLGVDLASFSAPKFGGPAGAGFLYKRRWVKMPIRRENVSTELAEQMGEALVKAETKRESEVKRLTKLRDYFIEGVIKAIPSVELNGSRESRLANNVNFVFPIESELLVIELDHAGIAASGGAACNARDCQDGSHVIMALGKSKLAAKSSARFSFGLGTTKKDLDYTIKCIVKIINKHKTLWPSPKKQ